ncbi:hypothetical protein ABZ714_09245 [Streptomyces sp. NPDC006798]|uniref:hypothetical protein n=1 Tax=Streptomyces sp. NPDC006798 TaxID=3155462 RepID=UPI0033C83AE4
MTVDGVGERVAAARRPGTPPERLRELAEPDPRIARIVASRIGLPPELADELAGWAADRGEAWWGVTRALAAEPAAPAARLAGYATHPDASVRRVAAVHRNTPRRALKKLAGDGETAVRRALAGREELPKGLVRRLAGDAAGDVRLTVARRTDTDPAVLRSLATDEDPRVRRVVAALGQGGGAEFDDEDPVVRRNAVRRAGPEVIAPLVAALARDLDPEVRALAAEQCRNRDPLALSVFAGDLNAGVRRRAAANRFTPVISLISLADDDDPEVRNALAENADAPPEALARLADGLLERWHPDDPDTGSLGLGKRPLVFALLDHPATPPGTLRRLYERGPSGFQQGNAVSGPNWPPELMARFALDYCAGLLDGEAERASHTAIGRALGTAPVEEVLTAMVHSPVYWLRGAVANRHVPPGVLADCAGEVDRGERTDHVEALAANPALPPEVQVRWARAGLRVYNLLRNPELCEAALLALADGPDQYWAEEARLALEVREHRTGTDETC